MELTSSLFEKVLRSALEENIEPNRASSLITLFCPPRDRRRLESINRPFSIQHLIFFKVTTLYE